MAATSRLAGQVAGNKSDSDDAARQATRPHQRRTQPGLGVFQALGKYVAASKDKRYNVL
jgi:hypothetical protein